MSVSAAELPSHAPLVRLVDNATVVLKEQEGAYIRLRIKHPEGKETVGDQIRFADRNELLSELVSRLAGYRTTDPVEIDLMSPGGKKRIDFVEIPPLMEAIEAALSARLNLARIEGTNQVILGAFEIIARQANWTMINANAMYSRWQDAEEQRLNTRMELLETQLLDALDWSEPDDPDVTKWKEIGGALRDALGPAGAKVAGLIEAYGKRLEKVQIEQKPTPQDNGNKAQQQQQQPEPEPEPEKKKKKKKAAPASSSGFEFPDDEPEKKSSDEELPDDEPEPEDDADELGQLIGFLCDVLDDQAATALLLEHPDVDKLKPHLGKLKAAAAILEQS